VLSVQSILNVVLNIYLVYHLISVLLQGGSENNNFVVFGHLLNELNAARAYQEEAIVTMLDIVDQGLIQIEYQCISGWVSYRVQERW